MTHRRAHQRPMTTTTGPGPDSRAGWPAAAAPGDYVLGGVRAVLPDAVIDDARVAGLRADLALVDDAGYWPVVRAVFRAG
jgi:hypothetical protein